MQRVKKNYIIDKNDSLSEYNEIPLLYQWRRLLQNLVQS